MKHFSIIILAILCAYMTEAQTRYLSEVFTSVKKTSNITYARNYSYLTGPTAPTLDSLKCDIYEPGGTDTLARRPLIIMLHAGSFLPAYINGQLQGSRVDSGLEFICKSFARRGYVVANIDYRLGWVPTNSVIDIRRGTIIQAAYRAVQDVRSAVRFFRKDARTTNVYGIDSNRVIVGGEYTGGLIAANYAALTSQNQIAIPKFISNITNTTFGYIAGLPYIRDSIMGDLDGFGGDSTKNYAKNSIGYNSKANFIFSFEAVVGDSSWITPGLPPMVSLHRINNKENSPYMNGIIYVFNPPNPPLSVVDVSGSGYFIPRTNQLGNNASFNPNTFNDPYTLRANAINSGQDGLFPLEDSNATIAWFDSVASVTECQLYGVPQANCIYIYQNETKNRTKAMAMSYVDTLMGYLNPRIYKSLKLDGKLGIQQPGSEHEIGVYPNPSPGSINIRSDRGIDFIAVKDLSGRTVRTQAGNKAQQLNVQLTGLPSGIYLITIQATNTVTTRRLLLH
jgi:acetyl esterase/lipase